MASVSSRLRAHADRGLDISQLSPQDLEGKKISTFVEGNWLNCEVIRYDDTAKQHLVLYEDQTTPTSLKLFGSDSERVKFRYQAEQTPGKAAESAPLSPSKKRASPRLKESPRPTKRLKKQAQSPSKATATKELETRKRSSSVSKSTPKSPAKPSRSPKGAMRNSSLKVLPIRGNPGNLLKAPKPFPPPTYSINRPTTKSQAQKETFEYLQSFTPAFKLQAADELVGKTLLVYWEAPYSGWYKAIVKEREGGSQKHVVFSPSDRQQYAMRLMNYPRASIFPWRFQHPESDDNEPENDESISDNAMDVDEFEDEGPPSIAQDISSPPRKTSTPHPEKKTKSRTKSKTSTTKKSKSTSKASGKSQKKSDISSTSKKRQKEDKLIGKMISIYKNEPHFAWLQGVVLGLAESGLYNVMMLDSRITEAVALDDRAPPGVKIEDWRFPEKGEKMHLQDAEVSLDFSEGGNLVDDDDSVQEAVELSDSEPLSPPGATSAATPKRNQTRTTPKRRRSLPPKPASQPESKEDESVPSYKTLDEIKKVFDIIEPDTVTQDSIIGKEVCVFWKGYGAYFHGRVVARSIDAHRHLIEFDGEEEPYAMRLIGYSDKVRDEFVVVVRK